MTEAMFPKTKELMEAEYKAFENIFNRLRLLETKCEYLEASIDELMRIVSSK